MVKRQNFWLYVHFVQGLNVDLTNLCLNQSPRYQAVCAASGRRASNTRADHSAVMAFDGPVADAGIVAGNPDLKKCRAKLLDLATICPAESPRQ